MPKTILVRPNVTLFRGLFEPAETEEVLSKRLDISRSSLRNILRGVEVSKFTLEKIAGKTGVPFHKLVSIGPNHLPSEPAFFESMRHGWFIENDRAGAGAPTWFRETIKLRRIRSEDGCRLQFAGRIKNTLNKEFEVKAELVGRRLLSIVSINRDSDLTFVAGVTTHLQKDGVNALCGTWTGHNHVGVPAVYRFVLTDTDEAVSCAFLSALCAEAKVAVVMNSKVGHRDIPSG